MRRITLGIAALVFYGISAQAVVQISWSQLGAQTILDQNSNPAPSTWLAQLIYSPTGTISPLNPANPLVPTGSEVVLASQALNNFGSPAGNGYLQPESDPLGVADTFAGGSVYTRVFNTDWNANPLLIVPPTFYGDSQVDGTLVIDDGNPTNGNDILTHTPALVANNIVVPEPTTYALLGIGGLLIVARRLRK